MEKYLLITVCEREIEAKQFETFEAARKEMIDDLKCEYIKGGENEEDFNSIDLSKYYYDETTGYDGFGVGSDFAWSNIQDDYNMDWKIVKIA